ncbi:MAG: patatin-like phospholipase family protein [Methylacidiphilales bacterium]|nr:patatin-like phospholipase family protein [Candidatus Methylacidiphilales bacterium]
MHNILSLDGGGTRGVFSIQILARMEKLLRQKYGRPDLVLADHFDFIGGTSTGAIIAALLSWGASMETVENFYLDQSRKVFGRKTWLKRFRFKFHAQELNQLLRDYFAEDGRPALLGTPRLRTLYLCVMRNASTGAPWIITNSPHAKYNQAHLADNNLKIPLYQLIRASTAAPVFFEPEEIEAGGQNWMFLDGAITPYNNPAFIMYLTATQGCFGNNWEDGVDKMRIISVGTGRKRVRFAKLHAADINIGDQLSHSLLALIDSNNQHQDLLCRAFGRCQWGEPIDTEIGDLITKEFKESDHRRFLYCRYNRNLTAEEMKEAEHISDFFSVDSLNGIPFWQKLGRAFAENNVRIEHLA